MKEKGSLHKPSYTFFSASRQRYARLNSRTPKRKHASVSFSRRYKPCVTAHGWQQPSVNTQSANTDTPDARLAHGDALRKALKLQQVNCKNN
ncbi:hypothetical protein JG687_00008529 [Phytophthora cactorum]|uniref:Uncharacterized protein n=1 Tax=Phytophthora cactorum TaxID=29920 RepID=A0A8T1UE27_9STRA|nr:hypothetical protein JG687_00008529 [Phytophthora cactorum]